MRPEGAATAADHDPLEREGGRIERRGSVPERVGVYLHAGQLFASQEPCEILTVLGLCVAVCLVDPRRKAGGANHYLLPTYEGSEPTPRFGDHAISELLSRMIALGSRKRDLVAKIFGGASLVRGETRGAGTSLGWKNVLVARAAMQAAGIPIAAEDVGGTVGRRLVLLTDEGFAWVKRL